MLHILGKGSTSGNKIPNAFGAIRFLTTTEISAALRPFYFTVHPDLFGQYPCQRQTNENSLKQLSSVIETLQSKRTHPPCQLQFYLRDKSLPEGNFRLIKIFLKERNLRNTILTILKSCDLSTAYIDSIKEVPETDPGLTMNNVETFRPKSRDIDLRKINKNDPLYWFVHIQSEINTAKKDVLLKEWLEKNHKQALSNFEASQPVREEISRMCKALCEKWELLDVVWDCGWDITHFRGCLQSFCALSEHHPEYMHVLKGKTLVFARFTGVSLGGQIMLNNSEVRHNWLDFIKNIDKQQATLTRIPAFEKALSQVLRNIRVRRRKFMPKVLAGEYERHVQQVTTSLMDYLCKRSYPESWPESLEEFEIVVETESAPLMVSPTGQFIAPATCPGSLLVSFITEHLSEAAEKISVYKSIKDVEKALHKQCVDEFKLDSLRKDDNVHPELMIQCCQKLLNNKHMLSYCTGLYLNISTYYSIMSDGTVCIPWNWK